MRAILLTSLLCPVLVLASPPSYEEQVRPIFKKHCLGCHNTDKRKADLDLSTYAGTLKGGSGGEVVKAGVPDSSWLVESIIHADGVEPMPPKKPKIPAAEIAVIREWIQAGLIEVSGGESKLRKIAFDVAEASSPRPEGEPAMPAGLAPVPPMEPSRPLAVTAIASSPWAPLVAVSGHEQVILRHAATGETLGVLPFPEGTVTVLRFSANGSLLLAAGGVGAESGKAVLYDVRSGRRVAEIGDELDAVLAADISADHRFVALGGSARVVKVFDARNGKLLHRIEKHTDWITSIAFAPDGELFASGDRNGGIHVWGAGNGGIEYTLAEHKQRIADLAWRGDGKMLASGGEDGRLILWDMKDGFPAKVVDAHRGKSETRYTRRTGILALEWHRSGELVTAGRDRRIRYWSVEGNPGKQIQSLPSLPTAIALTTADGNGVAGGFDGAVRAFSRDGLEQASPR